MSLQNGMKATPDISISDFARCLICEFGCSLAMFSVDYGLSLYCYDMGFSPRAATQVYGAYIGSSMLLSCHLGCVVDAIGIRWSLILGGSIGTIARLAFGIHPQPVIIILNSVLLIPASTVLCFVACKAGIKKYYGGESVATGFDSSYYVVNAAALASSGMLYFCRRLKSGGVYPAYFLLNCPLLIIVVMVALGLKGESILPKKLALRRVWEEQKNFVLKEDHGILLLAIFVGTGAIARHMSLTLPLLLIRTPERHHLPFEVLLSLNPILILLLMPLASGVKRAMDLGERASLLWGTALGSIAPIFMSVSPDQNGQIAAIVAQTLGEMLWAPTIVQWVALSADARQEGVLLALLTLPRGLGRLAAALEASVLLGSLCTATSCHDRAIWAIVALLGLLSPLSVWLFYRHSKPTDTPELLPTNGIATESCNLLGSDTVRSTRVRVPAAS